MRNISLLTLLLALLFTGCTSPPASNAPLLSRVLYRVTPKTITFGAIGPTNDPQRLDRLLWTVSATIQIAPFMPPLPPVALP